MDAERVRPCLGTARKPQFAARRGKGVDRADGLPSVRRTRVADRDGRSLRYVAACVSKTSGFTHTWTAWERIEGLAAACVVRGPSSFPKTPTSPIRRELLT